MFGKHAVRVTVAVLPACTDGQDVQIREAFPSDTSAIRRVHQASIEELGPAAYSTEQVEAWARGCESADYTTAIRADTDHVIVAETATGVVGFGSISFDVDVEAYVTAADAEITAVYVDPDSVRDGVGTAILTTLEQAARERMGAMIVLLSSLNAVPFYRQHGYERVRATAHEFSSRCSTGVEGEVIEMRKAL